MEAVLEFLSDILPRKSEQIVLAVGGSIGGFCAWAFGEFNTSIQWLFAFIVIDYITGLIAAYKTGSWCSSKGFKGIAKKVLILFVVSLCHGLDVTCHTDFIMSAAITAYSVNEVVSILENLDRLGLGGVIPGAVRKGLAVLKEKAEELPQEAVKGDDVK